MADKTNFGQSLMHMIKGNLGTGILAMPASFAHCGLVNAALGLPFLALVATYCVHLLVRSSQHLEAKIKGGQLEYAQLAKGAFKTGPRWMRRCSGPMCWLVDAVLIVSQLGICCVYLVFIVDNLSKILASNQLEVEQAHIFLAVLPVALLLSYIRTLKRLSYASACANALQVVGISIVIEFLLREMPAEPQIHNFRPWSEVALGFGSAMFAFEGISVVLPIYTRMKRPQQMGGWAGIINLSYAILLLLYFTVGFFGYMRFGDQAAGSVTLNLPKSPLYDAVRAIFTVSLFLTYPLQFYVPNEIIWNWCQARFLTPNPNQAAKLQQPRTAQQLLKFEYLCRTCLVLITFALAVTVPRLNLMMDLVGSISGTALSITLPALIHLAAFWEETAGASRAFMVAVDSALILFGMGASVSGSYFSFISIVQSFQPAAALNHTIH